VTHRLQLRGKKGRLERPAVSREDKKTMAVSAVGINRVASVWKGKEKKGEGEVFARWRASFFSPTRIWDGGIGDLPRKSPHHLAYLSEEEGERGK